MNSVKILLILALIFFGISAVNAEIYTWTDKNGVRHYGDFPPRMLQMPALYFRNISLMNPRTNSARSRKKSS